MNAIHALSLKTAIASGPKAASANTTGTVTAGKPGAKDNNSANDGNGGKDNGPFQHLLSAAFRTPTTPDDNTSPASTAGGQIVLPNSADAKAADQPDGSKINAALDSSDNSASSNIPVIPSIGKQQDSSDLNADQSGQNKDHNGDPLPATSAVGQGTNPPVKVTVAQTPTNLQAAVTVTPPTTSSQLSDGPGSGPDSVNARSGPTTDGSSDGTTRTGQPTVASSKTSSPTPSEHTPAPAINAAASDESDPEVTISSPTSVRDLTAHQPSSSSPQPQVLEAASRSALAATPEQHASTGNVSTTTQVDGTTQGASQVSYVRNQASAEPNATVGSTTPVATQIADAVVSKAGFMTQGGTTDIYLHLNPPELGTVNLHLRATGDTVTARVVVSSDATRSVIEQQLPDLRARLGESGITLGGFDVAQQHQNSQHQAQQPQEIDPITQGLPALPKAIAVQSSSSQTQRSGHLDVLV